MLEETIEFDSKKLEFKEREVDSMPSNKTICKELESYKNMFDK